MNIKKSILETVIYEAEDTFISKINTVSVAKKAGTSEAYIYKLFKTKNNLLTEAFLYIDEQIGKYIEETVPSIDLTILEEGFSFAKKVWCAYLHFFVKHPQYTHYYSAFRICKLYTLEISKRQEEHFRSLMMLFRFMNQDMQVFNIISFNLFWSFILDTTLLIARKMGNEEVEYTSQNIEISYHLIFDGLINILFKEEGNRN